MKSGSIVMCINDSNWPKAAYKKMSKLPVFGEVYTVREYFPPMPELDMEHGIALEEIDGQMDFFRSKRGGLIWLEYHFKMRRFIEIDMASDENEMEETEMMVLSAIK
jgi:hypothetical protein